MFASSLMDEWWQGYLLEISSDEYHWNYNKSINIGSDNGLVQS